MWEMWEFFIKCGHNFENVGNVGNVGPLGTLFIWSGPINMILYCKTGKFLWPSYTVGLGRDFRVPTVMENPEI